jgi:hypothetical protein
MKKRIGELPVLLKKLKKMVDECKKNKKCPNCEYPVGKLKKMPGHPTKIQYTPPQDEHYY